MDFTLATSEQAQFDITSREKITDVCLLTDVFTDKLQRIARSMQMSFLKAKNTVARSLFAIAVDSFTMSFKANNLAILFRIHIVNY